MSNEPIRQEFGKLEPGQYQPLGHISTIGDIWHWEYNPDNPYGHVEIVPDRRWRTRLRSFLARLADSVRGRK